MNATLRSAHPRLDALDMLRGIAILGVVLFHVSVHFRPAPALSSALALGNIGVQLFFLVSAVTMCHMWHLRPDEPMRTLKFYVRRFFRIAPLFWFAMLLYTLIWGTAPRGTAREELDALQFASTALFLHGFVPSAINSVVPGGWSIAVEMSFYVVFPLVASVRPHRLLPIALIAYLVFGVIATHALQGVDPGDGMQTFLYYSVLTQGPIFPIGMLVYWIGVQRHRVSLVPVVAVVAIWFAVAFAGRTHGFTTRPYFWLQIGLLALATGALLRGRWSVAWLCYLGRLSYSMYLFHFAVIAGLAASFGDQLGFATAAAITVLASTAVAELSHRTAERWSQTTGRLIIRSLQRSRVAPREALESVV